MLKIVCINQATVPLGCDFTALVANLNVYANDIFCPAWNLAPVDLVIGTKPEPDAWTMFFMDTSDVQGAEGYHDLTLADNGLPVAKIFVKSTLAAGDKIPGTASHELAEMLVDPLATLWVESPDGYLWAYETADAVEEQGFDVHGMVMSDFVLPPFFMTFTKPGTKLDYLGKVTKPFQLLPGGYATVMGANGKVDEIFGSEVKRGRFAEEDRAGHRSEYRRRVNFKQ